MTDDFCLSFPFILLADIASDCHESIISDQFDRFSMLPDVER